MSGIAISREGPGVWATHPGRACAQPGINPDLFFPNRGANSHHVAKARAICSTCPVQTDCADYAIRQSSSLFGIWGGLTVEDRRHARRLRRKVVA
jgi:WhiB family redox-sensing transcriptional regulator